jgi:hypothetical protein
VIVENLRNYLYFDANPFFIGLLIPFPTMPMLRRRRLRVEPPRLKTACRGSLAHVQGCLPAFGGRFLLVEMPPYHGYCIGLDNASSVGIQNGSQPKLSTQGMAYIRNGQSIKGWFISVVQLWAKYHRYREGMDLASSQSVSFTH